MCVRVCVCARARACARGTDNIFDSWGRQEGVAFLLPFMKKRIVKLDLADFSVLLTKRCMLFADLKTDGATQLCTDMGGGCMLFVLNSDEWTGPNSVYLAGWRGNAQLTLFVSKLEAQALSHKVLGTKTPAAVFLAVVYARCCVCTLRKAVRHTLSGLTGRRRGLGMCAKSRAGRH
jgi:hypothetical protein